MILFAIIIVLATNILIGISILKKTTAYLAIIAFGLMVIMAMLPWKLNKIAYLLIPSFVALLTHLITRKNNNQLKNFLPYFLTIILFIPFALDKSPNSEMYFGNQILFLIGFIFTIIQVIIFFYYLIILKPFKKKEISILSPTPSITKNAIPLWMWIILCLFFLSLIGKIVRQVSDRIASYRYQSYITNEITKIKSLSTDQSFISTDINYNKQKIPLTSKYISYMKDDYSIFLREIDNNKLSPEITLVTTEKEINYYAVDEHFKYLAYTYYANTLPSREENVFAITHGDTLILKNLDTGETKAIFSNLNDIHHQVSNFSFINNSDLLFVSLGDDIYLYNIITGQSEKYSITSDTHGACSGFYFIDKSPNEKNLILEYMCFEGSVVILFNKESNTVTNFGTRYVSGRALVRFLSDNEIYGYDYDAGEYGQINYLKLNLAGAIIEELPGPLDPEIPESPLIYHDDIGYYFIDESIKQEGSDDNYQIIGDNISELKAYYINQQISNYKDLSSTITPTQNIQSEHPADSNTSSIEKLVIEILNGNNLQDEITIRVEKMQGDFAQLIYDNAHHLWKKENNQWKKLDSTQDAYNCKIIIDEKVPPELVNICSSDDGALKYNENTKQWEAMTN